ncbi:hypothetical protein NQ176_g11060 [Zarea fungicola]|uniref:Uncharacterized protein n=1 Tax=Zarea fungicola TaxID=93591 RepID=A0ACC1MED2_9HYPO|nr:hypothetical protein NQ176_g11060 [Lecanicillium fungicola]
MIDCLLLLHRSARATNTSTAAADRRSKDQRWVWPWQPASLPFPFGLSLAPDAVSLRLTVVCVLFALHYGFIAAFAVAEGAYIDLPYGVMTLSLTLLCHAVDYLVVLRAASVEFLKTRGSSSPSLFARYIWTPLALLCNWRRLGTSWQIAKVPPFSRRAPSAVPSRAALIMRRLVYIAASLVVIDLCNISTVGDDAMMGQRALLSRMDQVTAEELLFRASVVVRYVLSAIAGVYLAYAVLTVVALALCLSSPAECPPMFGQLSKTYS